jgi:hypothetical protein
MFNLEIAELLIFIQTAQSTIVVLSLSAGASREVHALRIESRARPPKEHLKEGPHFWGCGLLRSGSA